MIFVGPGLVLMPPILDVFCALLEPFHLEMKIVPTVSVERMLLDPEMLSATCAHVVTSHLAMPLVARFAPPVRNLLMVSAAASALLDISQQPTARADARAAALVIKRLTITPTASLAQQTRFLTGMDPVFLVDRGNSPRDLVPRRAKVALAVTVSTQPGLVAHSASLASFRQTSQTALLAHRICTLRDSGNANACHVAPGSSRTILAVDANCVQLGFIRTVITSVYLADLQSSLTIWEQLPAKLAPVVPTGILPEPAALIASLASLLKKEVDVLLVRLVRLAPFTGLAAAYLVVLVQKPIPLQQVASCAALDFSLMMIMVANSVQ